MLQNDSSTNIMCKIFEKTCFLAKHLDMSLNVNDCLGKIYILLLVKALMIFECKKHSRVVARFESVLIDFI